MRGPVHVCPEFYPVKKCSIHRSVACGFAIGLVQIRIQCGHGCEPKTKKTKYTNNWFICFSKMNHSFPKCHIFSRYWKLFKYNMIFEYLFFFRIEKYKNIPRIIPGHWANLNSPSENFTLGYENHQFKS